MGIRKHPELDTPPDSLDWEAWCGPGGKTPYNSQIHPWNWRWVDNFGGGQLLDWVGHHVDIALWTLGLDKTGPTEVEGTGKKGDHDFFDTYVEYAYKGSFSDGRVFEVSSNHFGTKFTGENGWIQVNRGKLQASDREMLRNLPEDFESKIPSHQQDFINCVRSRELPTSDAEGSHRAASFGQLAIAAIDSGKKLKWDPAKEQVIGDVELAKHPRLGSRVRA
jgi:predicted dehydrogenase